MAALADIVLTPAKKDALQADCVRLAEAQIARLGGLRGITLKTGLAVIKAARPDILQRAVARLLPEFIATLDPLYQECAAAGAAGGFAGFLEKRKAEAVQAMLGVTDRRAAANSSSAVRSLYQRLRPGAEREVQAALPEFAAALARRL